MAARGLWIEMLALMHEANPRGHLLLNGRPMTNRQLAALAVCTVDEVETLLDELAAAGIFDRRKNGVIVSRRMEKDEQIARKNRENGKKGGNPSLSKQSEKSKSDNRQDKARIQNTDNRDVSDETSNVRAREFDAFWDLYPNKVGKGGARAKFAAARRKVDFDTLMAGLRRYVAKTDDRPWCNPTTWLNQERWTDEPAGPLPRGSPGKPNSFRAEIERQMQEAENGADRSGATGDHQPALRLISAGRG